MLIDRRTGMAALFAGVATLAAATVATEFAWGARSSEIDAHLTQVGEIYLDGSKLPIRQKISNKHSLSNTAHRFGIPKTDLSLTQKQFDQPRFLQPIEHT